jgi:hypothetical protein
VPAAALRIVRLRGGGELPAAILDWVFGGEPARSIFDRVREEVPAFDEGEEADLLERVSELSRTVASLTGLDLVSEAWEALGQEGEPPDLESMYGGEEPSTLDVVADANVQSAYSRGKLDEDAGADDWWEYVTQLGACEICAPLDGTQAPQDDGIWSDRIPPLHPRCVCELKPIPAQKIRATEHDVPDEARGSQGWGNPQKMFSPDLSDKPAALLPLYEQHLRNLRRAK